MIIDKLKMLVFAFMLPVVVGAQNVKQITILQAVEQGIANSKNFKLLQNKINRLNAYLEILKDEALPAGNVSLKYDHAEIPLNISMGGGNPIILPQHANTFTGTAALMQLVYSGGKLKWVKEFAKPPIQAAGLDAEKDNEEMTFAIISSYCNPYKVLPSKKIVMQNLQSVAQQIKQAEQFFDQGIVIKNDGLCFQLQQANVLLKEIEIENNRKIINYNLDILLGLPEDNQEEVNTVWEPISKVQLLTTYLDLAYANRQEFKQTDIRNKVSAVGIKTIKANAQPNFGLATGFYLSSNGNVIPQTKQYLIPVTAGANLSWNFGTLWSNKNKIAEAMIQQQEINIQKIILLDQVKSEVNKNYQSFNLALKKIQMLASAVWQAAENNLLLTSKYKNNIASVTDLIDAETILYQAKIDLEVAKTDAGIGLL